MLVDSSYQVCILEKTEPGLRFYAFAYEETG